MASVEQWAKWYEEYLSGLKAIVDNAPYAFAEFSAKKEFGYFDIEKAKAFVDEAIRLGLISTKDSDYFQKAVFFAETPSAEKYYGKSYSIQETLELYKEAKPELEGMDNYITLVHFGLIHPLRKACYYVFCNHPVSMKVALAKLITVTNINIKFDTFRLGLKELFTFLQGMTLYGLNGLLTDIKCSANYSDDIFDAIQNKDFDSFKALCRDGEIDLTEIAEIAGYIEAVYGKASEDEESIDFVKEDGLSYARPLLTMMGLSADNVIEDVSSVNLGQELLSELWPNANGDFAQTITLLAMDLANLYHYIDYFNEEELNEVDRILNNPLFEPFSKIAQLLFATVFKHLPNAVKICFTQDEQNEIATLYFKDEESGDTEQNSQANYSDNQPEPNDQEQVQPVGSTQMKAEGVPEKAVNSELNLEDFSLPEDLFDSKLYPVDQKNPDQHFSLNYDVKAAGVEKLCKLVNKLASIGYVSGNDRTLRLLTYVLTGKLKPEDYVEGEKVKWLDDGYGDELLYVIRYIIGNEKGKYKKAKKLFDCLWMRKNRTSKREYRPQDSAQCANVEFMRALHDIYPKVCPEKSKHVKSF